MARVELKQAKFSKKYFQHEIFTTYGMWHRKTYIIPNRSTACMLWCFRPTINTVTVEHLVMDSPRYGPSPKLCHINNTFSTSNRRKTSYLWTTDRKHAPKGQVTVQNNLIQRLKPRVKTIG